MDSRSIKRLKIERARRLDEASQMLLKSDDVKRVKEHLTWIETASDLIEASRGNIKFIWSLIIGSICLLLVGLVTTIHLFNTQISLELETENLVIRLNRNWSLQECIRADDFSINNLNSLEALDLVCADTPGEECPLHSLKELAPTKFILTEGEIDLISLNVEQGAEIDMSAAGNNLRLFIKNSAVKGKLQILKGVIGLDSERLKVASQDTEIPATISFETVKTVADPVLIEFAFPEKSALPGLYIDNMNFTEEYPPGTGNFQCSIHSGVLNLIDIDKTRQLRNADCMVLKDIETRRMKVMRKTQSILVNWDGSVTSVHTGPEAHLRNATPTWLEYIYYEKRFTFLWSSIAFLWGLLWSIRNTIFK